MLVKSGGKKYQILSKKSFTYTYNYDIFIIKVFVKSMVFSSGGKLMGNDLSGFSYSDCCAIKQSVVELMGIASSLAYKFQGEDDYKSLKTVDNMALCCFHILSRIINTEELIKQGDYEPVTVNLSSLGESLVMACRSRLRNMHIRIVPEIEEDLFVLADADRLISCLMNLIVNSVQNISCDDGEIKLKIHKINSSVLVTVSDNGYGCDRAAIEELLASEDYRGGLAVVKGFCEKAGTSMYYDTNVDGGLVVSFRLPISDPRDLQLKSGRFYVPTGPLSPVNIYLSKIDDAVIEY